MIDPAADDHAEIRSVGRALDLLDFMQRAAPAGIRVRDAAAHLGIDPATASRLLATLISPPRAREPDMGSLRAAPRNVVARSFARRTSSGQFTGLVTGAP